jgi:hypothetical protein
VIDVFRPSLTVMTNVEVFRRYGFPRIRSLLSCSLGREVLTVSCAATLGIEWLEYSTDGLFWLPRRSRIGTVEIAPRSLACGESRQATDA